MRCLRMRIDDLNSLFFFLVECGRPQMLEVVVFAVHREQHGYVS